MRSGTLPTPLCVGLGEACRIAQSEMADEAERLRHLRESLLGGLRQRLGEVFVNGDLEARIPGNLNLGFASVNAEALMMEVRDVAVSSGSACTSESVEPSYVLRALGLSDEAAQSSLRFGLGRFTTVQEIDQVVELLAAAVGRLRQSGPQRQSVEQ